MYGQLHEGLRYEIMRAPGVSGVDSYSALCIAAKSEERRLQELRKKQQPPPRPSQLEDMGLPTPSMRRDVMVRAISVPVLYVINPADYEWVRT